MGHAPGLIRDSIIGFLAELGTDASIKEIERAVAARLGGIPQSSIRSYLNLNVGQSFERTARGRYMLRAERTELPAPGDEVADHPPAVAIGKAVLHAADCFSWLARQKPASFHACVTDPPYGLVEYTPGEQAKLRSGRGGVWRVPPSFDGHQRAPLPRFTVLDAGDREALFGFFKTFGMLLGRVLVPGANVVVASNPLLSHIVASAISEAGLELRGSITRLTMTMRGGDRPKNAHTEFPDVSVMPRSMFEPWIVFRTPLEGRVQDNLRAWKTGGFRRVSDHQPFGDVIASRPTPRREKAIAPHPSLKPQAFLRQVVRASLPLGEGVVLDPFAGSGSTLAAANAVGYASVGVENDPQYVAIARTAIAKLGQLVDPV